MMMKMGIEGTRSAWIKRYHEQSLGGLEMSYWVKDGKLGIEMFERQRFASLEDKDEMWKILTNDMELNGEVAMKILESVAPKTTVASSEAI